MLELLALESDKCPPIAAFCELAVRLYTPNLNNLGAKSPIVSSLHLKYSRFWETRAGDRVRSTLRGVEGSQPFKGDGTKLTKPRIFRAGSGFERTSIEGDQRRRWVIFWTSARF
jgi:hypothetical protein